MSVQINPDQCIACTTCLVQCPVAEATPKFPGPRMIGPAYERFRRMGLEEDPSLQYCTNCKNCDISCPQGVPVANINMLARLAQCEKKRPGLRDWVLAHGDKEARLLSLVPAWLKNLGMNNPLTRAVLDRLGIARQATLPAYAAQSFRRQAAALSQPELPRQVVLFPGCYMDIYDPATGMDLVWLLNRAGFRVIVPRGLVCCGLPLVANGFQAEARANAVRNMAELARWQQQGLPLLTICPSCRLMFRAELPLFFPELEAQYGPLPMQDACAFLLDCVDSGLLQAPETGEAARSIIYHAPCHLRAQGCGLPGLSLLRRLSFKAENADAGCCGLCGSYGFKKEKYAISQQIGERLFARVRASGAECAASECGTCRLQITHGSGLPCPHPLSLVRRRLSGLH